jgi:hypothetical protein
VKSPTTAPQAFPVTGIVGLEGAVGVVGVELEPPPPQARAATMASGRMARAARAEVVGTNIRKRTFLSDHQGRGVVRPPPELSTRLLHECGVCERAGQAPTDYGLNRPGLTPGAGAT